MRRTFRAASLGVAASLIVAAPVVHGSEPAAPGFMPADARVLGYSLTDLATAWNLWASGAAPEVNPLLQVRCEQSSLDPRIYFLPVSLGGEWTNTCVVPPGSFLVLTPGAWECSSVEPEPYFGADEEGLRACVDAGFSLLSYVEVTLDGTRATNLADDIVTTHLTPLPPNNLASTQPGLSMMKGYFLVIHSLSPGVHTLRAYDEFASFGFRAGITYTIIVQ